MGVWKEILKVKYIYNKNKNNMAKKQLIRLTEGDLHRIIKESVNKMLNENDYIDNYTKDTRNRLANTNLLQYADGDFGGDYEMDVALINDWDGMCDKLSKYKNPSEVLDKLINKNPIFKKWYENNHKKRENESSWRQFDEYKNDVKDLYDDEKYELDFRS